MFKDQLSQILNDLSALSTESSLILGACALLMVGLFSKSNALLKSAFMVILALAAYFSLQEATVGFALRDSIRTTDVSVLFSSLLVITSGSLVLFPRRQHVTEFYFMMLSLLVGSLFMIKANSLLVLYLAVELVSYVSYVLTNFSFTKQGSESAIKYLLFGALSSAILLIGLGLVYGTTGSFYLAELDSNMFQSLLSQVGLLFIIFGILFKASIFPFHIWTPAVYQSAPVDSIAIFSVIPKLSGLVLLHNLFSQVNLPITHWITELTIMLGITTIVIGTFGAIMQSNTRRMIAFGSIAHSGFLLAFVLAGQLELKGFWFYSVTYAIMNIGVFYLINLFETNDIKINKDYSNVKGHSMLLVSFTLMLLSLVGIPPLAGFTAKFLLFSRMWEWYQHSQSTLVLSWLIVAVFATVVALFYYLRVPYFYFLKNNAIVLKSKSMEIAPSTKIIATLFGVILLLLFFVPNLVI